jgi:DUF4097 and DUF4098 domain-containing protein YvlB
MFLLLLWAINFGYQLEKELILSAKGIEQLNIEFEAGFLIIKGVEALENIKVKATIVVRGIKESRIQSFIDKQIRLSLSKKSSRAVLISEINNSSFSFFKRREALINLLIEVPAHLYLDIKDGSGFIEIKNILNDVEIKDGSGYITIDQIKGNLNIHDGSGSIEITQVDKNVKIDDGSGDISARLINGNLKIDDTSGGINIQDVGGDVWIDDGSGEIDIYKIKGSVTIDDGSGGIDINHVGKDVKIIEAGSGYLSINNVKGTVRK